MKLSERYEELRDRMPDGFDADDYVHGAAIEEYIMLMAERLGFRHPTLALNLEVPLVTLLERDR